jgi:hypothetical protein
MEEERAPTAWLATNDDFYYRRNLAGQGKINGSRATISTGAEAPEKGAKYERSK